MHMDRNNRITNENLLYGLIFLAALLVRLLLLGQTPLLESEAGWAYQAWQFSRGENIAVGSQVGYLAVSGGLFTLFGGSDFLARFWPAFVGSLAVWIPFLLRKKIAPVPALVTAAGLALDPALVAVSRLAGGPVPGLVFLGLALAAFHTSRMSWAVFFTGLGLLSGPDYWLGLLLLGAVLLVSKLAGFFNPGEYLRTRIAKFKESSDEGLSRLLLPVLLLGLLGSFALTNFQGLTAWVGALPEFVSSWVRPQGISPVRLLTALLISNPFTLLFGGVGMIVSWRIGDRTGKLLSICLGVVVLILLIYPDRQAEDLIWMAIPLWWAAAVELVRIYESARDSWAAYAFAGLVAVLLTLNWLTFIGMVFQPVTNRTLPLQLGLFAASLALVIISMIIVSSEWGGSAAWKGLAAGVGLVLVLYLISSMTLEAYLREKDPRSLFAGGRGSGQLELLRDSIADASLTATGRRDSIQGIATAESDSLRWALRDFQEIRFSSAIDPGNPAPLLITPAEDFSRVDGEIYRGQDFVISTRPGWKGVVPDDWISWIAFRFGPIEREHIILWIRNDIYSGY